ncbi:uncharacterized protein LACBIDRAFT_293251 [Laccaria bicolor S238N-H82]|uniref:Predicted protein n=1 Tax=Laccaria bicolor (strain S238N-H82 / ATCC MYA-4686) TaxID=486041 RepID=B0D2A1_LACBS|nr:uncharacterized protein LACBIDRAFT_293251 [Laccaria bicolor S238N-H82]EDR10707.1 predicted protein [Laccaria bicolor S238N-H82]|eukprot:XP_001878008.1 predicted protein [Laccaria bicolor S238N-H82]
MSSSPVHYIRTIQTSFTSAHPHSSHSKWAAARSAHHPHANLLLNSQYHHQQQQQQQQQLPPPSTQKYPPGLITTPVVGRRRSSSIRRPASSQLSATPSSSLTSPKSSPFKFDPFADDPTPSPAPQLSTTRSGASYKTSPTPNNSRPLTPPPAPQHYTIQIPAAPTQRRSSPPVTDRDAKAKLVAGILLNRIHAVGRPRRQFSYASEQPKVYVKSGLSSVVSVEA